MTSRPDRLTSLVPAAPQLAQHAENLLSEKEARRAREEEHRRALAKAGGIPEKIIDECEASLRRAQSFNDMLQDIFGGRP